MGETKGYSTIDEYIAQIEVTEEVRERLDAMRACIRAAAPEAQERMSWRMPTFYYHGNLVHFAAHKGHIGFYPSPSGIEHFEKQLAEYKTSKGAVQFPHTKPLPLELIREIVLFRVAENEAER